MIINAQLQRLKQGGFAVVTASYNEGNSLFDTHPREGTVMRECKCDLHGGGGSERDPVFHRLVRYAGLSGQDGSVCHKGTQIQIGKPGTDIMLILSQMDDLLHPGGG